MLLELRQALFVRTRITTCLFLLTLAGNWSNSTGFKPVDFMRDEHNSSRVYASKTFDDTKNKRRVFWGWLQAGGNTMTLPRLVTHNAQLNLLEFAPLPELKQLRQSPPLFEAEPAAALANFSAGGTAAKPWPVPSLRLLLISHQDYHILCLSS